MARRNQGINVKVPRAKVIKALEQALVKLETNYRNQAANEKKYNAAIDKWREQVAKLAATKISKAQNLKAVVRWNNTINVEFDLPAGSVSLPTEPEKNYDTMLDWQYEDSKEEIENAIRVLNMCDDEHISTATYGGISKYL